MSTFEKVIYFLRATMEVPKSYGWFHLLFICLIVGFTVALCVLFKNCSDRAFRRIALICWAVITVFEVYKQISFSFTYDGVNPVEWIYQWYAFPFQLCSTPIYVLPLIAFLKDSKLRDALIAYMSTFSLFGGLVVFIYPNDVFISIIGINIQTMIHHGIQIALGIFFAVYSRRKLSVKYHLTGVVAFVAFVAVSIVLNESIYAYFINNGMTGPNAVLNMFYISSHFDCTLPILSGIYKVVPYPVFVLIYILGFTVVSFVIYFIEKLFTSLGGKGKKVNA